MKTLYLHIGTPKTATSSIQTFLSQNRKLLQEKNYCFPKQQHRFPYVGTGRNAHFMIDIQYHEDGSRNREREAEMLREGMDFVNDCMKQYDNVILSEESIFRAAVYTRQEVFPYLKKEADEHGYQVKIIVYLRRQDKFLISDWNQRVKQVKTSYTLTIDEHRKQTQKKYNLVLDYAKRLDKIAEVFGRENIIVRRFEPASWVNNSIIDDFMHCIGLEMTEEFRLPEFMVNPGLSENNAEIKRIINGCPVITKEENIYLNRLLRELAPASQEANPCSMFSPEDIRELLQKYEEGNARVAKEYIGDGAPMFSDEIADLPRWNRDNPRMLEDVIHFFSAVTVDLHRENESLRQELAQLTERINTEHRRLTEFRGKVNHPIRTLFNRFRKKAGGIAAALTAALLLTSCGQPGSGGSATITNVSYDPTREFYAAYNELFKDHWLEKSGQEVTIIQSHGGSGKQALEVANGLPADVVTLALESDVDAVKDAGLIDEGYTGEFPGASSPYTSCIVFLVRSGNPKNILDWDDLLKDDVGIITPNPKTSGGARWNYLAAWYYFEKQGLDEAAVTANMKTIFEHVLVLDSGARGSTTSFVENGQGDVLLAWENEAFLSLEQHPGDYEIVVPSVSILCQPTVAVVDRNAEKNGTAEICTEYLNYLYSDEAQRLEASMYYRPSSEAITEEFVYEGSGSTITELPEDHRWLISDIDLADISHFGGWDAATEKHFSSGGIFDSIFEE